MSFSVTILGSSSALPTSKRNLTAHLVNHDERFFLIDCGEGTQMQLRRFKQKTGRINHIFISHLHGDHVFGLFGLLSSYSMLGRKSELHIYANPQIKEILDSHFVFFQDNLNYPIVYHFFLAKKSQVIYEDEKFEVLTIPLKHRIPCVGFLFREKPKQKNILKKFIELYKPGIKDIINIKNGADFITTDGKIIPNQQLTIAPHPSKSYAYCTDTKYTESIVPFIENIDLLFHEATFLDEDSKLAKTTFHSTTVQAAKIAQLANVKKLVVGHFSSRYKNDWQFLKETSAIFPNTIMAEDGMEIQIGL
jgi:ribonuclease Z